MSVAQPGRPDTSPRASGERSEFAVREFRVRCPAPPHKLLTRNRSRDFDLSSRPRRGYWRLLFALLLIAIPAFAVEPGERLADPALEARAREISRELRCLVCQNQSIDDSSADLARDLRILLRERITAGDTDEEAVAFIVDRYGDYVLLRPPFRIDTLLLWLGPPLLLVLGGGVAWLALRRRRRAVPAEAPLTPEEEQALAAALGGREPPP
jgi:cytochrome c-type biogenesis protein CcmH